MEACNRLASFPGLPRGVEEEGPACACSLISRHSRNSVYSTHGFLRVVFVTTVDYPDTFSVIYRLAGRLLVDGFHRAVATLFNVCSARLCS